MRIQSSSRGAGRGALAEAAVGFGAAAAGLGEGSARLGGTAPFSVMNTSVAISAWVFEPFVVPLPEAPTLEERFAARFPGGLRPLSALRR